MKKRAFADIPVLILISQEQNILSSWARTFFHLHSWKFITSSPSHPIHFTFASIFNPTRSPFVISPSNPIDSLVFYREKIYL